MASLFAVLYGDAEPFRADGTIVESTFNGEQNRCVTFFLTPIRIPS